MSGPIGASSWMYGIEPTFYDYKIDQSLRFNAADSAYLSRTPSSGGNRRTFTFSCWVKRSNLGEQALLDAYSDDSNRTRLMIDAGNRFQVFTRLSGADHTLICNAVSRDSSAWYHVVYAIDTTQSTASDRVKIYINGEAQTFTGSGFPDQNEDTFVNHTVGHSIGSGNDSGGREIYFNGYMAEVNLVDGSSLAPTQFGETKDGIWIPKEYSGSYGTNGFYLPFDDSSAIGDDESPNTNDFTVTNLAATDVVLDSPTNNFATMNPSFSGNSAVLHEGALKVALGGFSTTLYGSISTMVVPRDKKIYIEVEETVTTGDGWAAGFATATALNAAVGGTAVGGDGTIAIYNRSAQINGSETDYGSSAGLGGFGIAKLAAGDILGCMVDGATGKVWFSRNGTYFKTATTDNSGTTGNPAGGSHEIGTLTGGSTDDIFFYVVGGTNVDNLWINFGQDSTNVSSANADANDIGTFEYAPPTDYLSLCSNNMSDTTIGPMQDTQADDHFNTVTYNGTGSSNSITGVGFQPDWVWGKRRDTTGNHWLNDVVRGATKGLHSDSINNEYTDATVMNAFNTDGFTVVSHAISNASGGTYVAWNWKAGTAFSNSAGSNGATIASSGQANTTSGFSIVSYTGTGSAGTIKHGLSAAPEMLIIKELNATSQWVVGHHKLDASAPFDKGLYLDDTRAVYDDATNFNDTAPTSAVFSVGTGGYVNDSGNTYICYAFHSVEGYCKVGSYVGNSSSDGTFVYLGFRPAWIMLKKIDSTAYNWNIHDTARDTTNVDATNLWADSTVVENGIGNASDWQVDMLSNGFKLRENTNYINQSGKTVIYLAFAEQPAKYSNAR